jgi:hypothetical protein
LVVQLVWAWVTSSLQKKHKISDIVVSESHASVFDILAFKISTMPDSDSIGCTVSLDLVWVWMTSPLKKTYKILDCLALFSP